MKILKTFFFSLAVLGLSMGSVNAQFAGGNGSAEQPYQIATAEQLETLASLVNAGDYNYFSKHYILNNDIDISGYAAGEGWEPIGKGLETDKEFKGTFDGNN
jgi:hypothetical protein